MSTKPRQRGRPEALTPDTHSRNVSAVRGGNYLRVAAAYAGISKSSLFSWLKRGEIESEGIYRELLDSIRRAQAVSESRDLASITKAAKAQWQAAAWLLEKRFPERWARKKRIGSTVLAGKTDVASNHSFGGRQVALFRGTTKLFRKNINNI